MNYTDLLVEKREGIGFITINRPAVLNAFRGQTVDELISAIESLGWDKDVGVLVLAGAGDRAFCVGGDQGVHDGQYDGRGTIGMLGGRSPYHLIAVLSFDSVADVQAALTSPEGQATAADIGNFATGGVDILFAEMKEI